MKIYDVSLPLKEGIPCFPGDPEFKISPHFSKKKGDPFNLAALSLCTHTGTHIDPPAHYIEGGSTVDEIPLDFLMGPSFVLDLRGVREITAEVLEQQKLTHVERILFKTDNENLLYESRFHENYVYLTEDGAEFLLQRGVKLVGIDYLSIEKYMNPGAPVHTKLMNASVVIVEGVNLIDIQPGQYEILCLPLLIHGGDGAPARVLLRQMETEE